MSWILMFVYVFEGESEGLKWFDSLNASLGCARGDLKVGFWGPQGNCELK